MNELEELKHQNSVLYGMVNAQRHLLISLVLHSEDIEAVLATFDQIHKSNFDEMFFNVFTDKEISDQETCYTHLRDYVKSLILLRQE